MLLQKFSFSRFKCLHLSHVLHWGWWNWKWVNRESIITHRTKNLCMQIEFLVRTSNNEIQFLSRHRCRLFVVHACGWKSSIVVWRSFIDSSSIEKKTLHCLLYSPGTFRFALSPLGKFTYLIVILIIYLFSFQFQMADEAEFSKKAAVWINFQQDEVKLRHQLTALGG